MTTTQHDSGIDRRKFLRRSATTVAVGGGLAEAGRRGKITGLNPVGSAKAHPAGAAVIKGLIAAGSAAAGYYAGARQAEENDAEEAVEEARQDDLRQGISSMASTWDSLETKWQRELKLDADGAVEFNATSNTMWREIRIETIKAFYDDMSVSAAQDRVDNVIDDDFTRGVLNTINPWNLWQLESLQYWTGIIEQEMHGDGEDIQLQYEDEVYGLDPSGAESLEAEYPEIEVVGSDIESPLVKIELRDTLPSDPANIDDYDGDDLFAVGIMTDGGLFSPVAIDGHYTAEAMELPDIEEAVAIGEGEELEIWNAHDDELLFDLDRTQRVIHAIGEAHQSAIESSDEFVDNAFARLEEDGYGPDTILGPQDLISGWGYAPEQSRADVEMLMTQLELPDDRGVRFDVREYDSDGNFVRERTGAMMFISPVDEEIVVEEGEVLTRGVDYDYIQTGLPGADGDAYTDTDTTIQEDAGGSVEIVGIDGADEVSFNSWNEPVYDETDEEDIERAINDAEENQELWNEVWDEFQTSFIGWLDNVGPGGLGTIALAAVLVWAFLQSDQSLSDFLGAGSEGGDRNRET